jgi:hypothetical protein
METRRVLSVSRPSGALDPAGSCRADAARVGTARA